MFEHDFIFKLRCELAKLGCPPHHLQRLTREVEDHREDLHQAAVAEGFSDRDANSRAEAKLGQPELLAGQLMESLRRSSWIGRHSVITCMVLPLLVTPVLWAIGLFLTLAIVMVPVGMADHWNFWKLSNDPARFAYIMLAIRCGDWLAIALPTWIFCKLARRATLDFKWAWGICAICAFHGAFLDLEIKPHFIWLQLYSRPDWLRMTIPFLIGAAFHWASRRNLKATLSSASA